MPDVNARTSGEHPNFVGCRGNEMTPRDQLARKTLRQVEQNWSKTWLATAPNSARVQPTAAYGTA